MRYSIAAAIAILSTVCTLAGAGSPTITAFIKTGDPVPGLPGFTFGSAGPSCLSSDGSVLFVGAISGPGTNLFNDHVLCVERPDGTRELLARENDPVPGAPGFVYRGGSANTSVFLYPVVTPAGTLGVTCEVLQGATVRTMILTDTPLGPGLTPTAFETMPVTADLGDSIFVLEEQSTSIHEGGLVAFGGRVLDDIEGVADSVWYGSSLGISTSLQTQLPAPGFGPGVDVLSFDRSNVASNMFGELVFGAFIDGPGILNAERNVIYSGPPTNLGVLEQSGRGVPGLAGATFFSFDERTIRVNAAGAVCFFAHYNTNSGPPNVLMSYGGGQGFALCHDGLPVSQIPGAAFDVVGGRCEMNANAEIAFNTKLTGVPASQDSALCIGSPAGIDFVVREGDVIDGHTVGEIGSAYFAINDRRDVVAQLSLDSQLAFVAFPGDGSQPIVLARMTEVVVTDRGNILPFNTVPWRIDTRNGSPETGKPMALDNRGRFALNILGGAGDWLVIFDIDGPCVADLTNDNTVDFADVSAFLAAFAAGDMDVDFDDSGVLDFGDVSAFLAAFPGGCP